MKYSIALILAVTGCITTAQSSRAVLGPTLAQLEIRLPPREAGSEITKLLANRGYMLVDQQPTGAGLALRFQGNREPATLDKGYSTQFGSTFSVSISQAPGDHSMVSIDGSPMIDSAVACTSDTHESCDKTYFPVAAADHINGRAEADVVYGVFSELALGDLVVGSVPARAAVPVSTASPACLAERHRVLVEAKGIEDQYERMKLIETAPTC
jgi:hypothetical protein